MKREELLAIISEVQQHQSELDDVEVKSAASGTPTRLHEPLSSFSNHHGGGVILCGLDENKNFGIVGVRNVHKLQEDVSNLASHEMEPALCPEFTVEQIDGKTVAAIEVAEVPLEQKPCYYRRAGVQGGSYIRVGNTDRRMTDYEIFGYTSARSQPTLDEEPVVKATIADLNQDHLQQYVGQLQRHRPQASFLKQPLEQALKRLHVLQELKGTLHPTLAGLLMFGQYPQEFEPQLVITFLQYYGTNEEEKTPRGERFLDNRKFEGPIPEMINGAVNHVMATIRKSSLIEGLWRRDIPEYPDEALREAIVNAVAHRDYSHFVRGSYIQVRLFADRLEVQSPGGLYGNVTEENLEEEQSTRNRLLMRLMEDAHLVENRGSGIQAMITAMRNASLGPPRFRDRRSSFCVTLNNLTLMSPDAIAWLNQFANRPINDHQRLALVFLRANQQVTNSDYRRLNHVDPVIANRELRGLLAQGLIQQHGSKRWAYYTLAVPATIEAPAADKTDEDKILTYVREHGSIGNAECRVLLGVEMLRAWYLLKRLSARGSLRRVGTKRWARYVLP